MPAALETLGRLLALMVNELPQAFILKKAIVSLGMEVTEERYLFFLGVAASGSILTIRQADPTAISRYLG